MTDIQKNQLAADLVLAWAKYAAALGEPPHGTIKQLRAMLEFIPRPAKTIFLAELGPVTYVVIADDEAEARSMMYPQGKWLFNVVGSADADWASEVLTRTEE